MRACISSLVNAPNRLGKPLKVGFLVSRMGTGLASYPRSVLSPLEAGRPAVAQWISASELALLRFSGLRWTQQLKAALPNTMCAHRRKQELFLPMPFRSWGGKWFQFPSILLLAFHWPELVTWPPLPPITGGGSHDSFLVAGHIATQRTGVLLAGKNGEELLDVWAAGLPSWKVGLCSVEWSELSG